MNKRITDLEINPFNGVKTIRCPECNTCDVEYEEANDYMCNRCGKHFSKIIIDGKEYL